MQEKSSLGRRDKVIYCGWAEVAVDSGKTVSQKPLSSEAGCLQESLAWQKGNEGAQGLCASHWPGFWGGCALTDIRQVEWESVTLAC